LLQVKERTSLVQVSQHERDCCVGSDGVIGPDLLPFATIRWRNWSAPPASSTITLPLTADARTGLSARSGVASVQLRFALSQPKSVATAAAAAALAREWGGAWNGDVGSAKLDFGITRPIRPMRFSRPGLLAGFRFDTLPVRVADFAGETSLPSDPELADEVVVSHPLPFQQPWPAVTIGLDQLSRCAEIVYQAAPRRLTLSCAFDQR
jgi:hypothetical protein